MVQRAVRSENVVEMDDARWEAMLRGADAQVHDVTKQEAHALFDQQAREIMGMGGEEFLRRYDMGEFRDIPDDAEHTAYWFLTMLIPLGR
ncbi:MAG: hypothetical protein ACRDJW_07520 [Thermomicrobiales bacterium]